MKRLLIVFHAPSENTLRIRDAMQSAAKDVIQAENLDVSLSVKSPFDTQSEDVMAADGIILGTTENLSYMSGALKDFFDRCYYPVLEEKQGLPVAAVVRAGHDGTGTCNALKTILTGLRWRWVQEPIVCRGEWQETFINDCEELAQAMAYGLAQGVI